MGVHRAIPSSGIFRMDCFNSRSSRLATFLFLALASWLAGSSVRAQDSSAVFDEGFEVPDSVFSVDTVVISGNKKTKDFVILREMSLKRGTPITTEQLRYDQQRIYSIGLFNQVQMRVAPTSPARANVYIHVVERWYLLPYPIMGLKDGDWHKFYFGLGIVHNNFRGRNEKLFATAALGYDPWGSLAYRNPFVDEEGTMFFEGRIAFNRVRNRSQQVLVVPTDQFDEQHFSVSTTLGKRYGNFQTAWATLEYQAVTINYVPHPTISASGTDRFPMAALGYAYDTRDLIEYPGDGVFLALTATKYGTPGKQLDFIRYGIDGRKFLPLALSWVAAGRVFANLEAGSASPSYDHLFLGYQFKVRGHYGETLEGENIIGATAEFHHTLIPPFYFKWDFLPSQFGVWKFGVTLAAFADAGMVWYRGDVVSWDRSLRGYGMGVHFELPYGFLLRTEYAMNEVRHGQFIIDLGAGL